MNQYLQLQQFLCSNLKNRIDEFSKRVFALFVFFILLLNNSFAFDKRFLLRDISSQNQLETEHFNIYWSDDYEQSNLWLSIIDDYPRFISRLKDISEEVYQSFETQGFDMPNRIEIYVANSGMLADGLVTNDISSLGAFTSDDYPEILINAEIELKNLDNDIRRILYHEMTHLLHHQYKILSDELDVDDKIKWFTEGTAVFSEALYMDNPSYMYEYFEYLDMSDGFFSIKSYASYSNSFLFYYLNKTFTYDLEDFLDIYKSNPTPIEFMTYIANEQNSTAIEVLTDIYDSFLYQKELYGEEFKNINITQEQISDIQERNFLKIKNMNFANSWRLISFPIQVDDFSQFEDSEYIIWTYKNNQWYIKTNKNITNNTINQIDKISPSDGVWIKSDDNISLSFQYF
jgi:hypothetical protein